MKRKRQEKQGVSYDPAVIIIFANELYRRSNVISFSYAMVGLFLGGCFGFAFIFLQSYIMNIFGAIIGSVIGYAVGRAKAFSLRLEAQQALCQLQIELNTRRG